MKTYNVTNRTSLQAKNAISKILDTCEYYKNSYFWDSARSASNRRSNEVNFKGQNPTVGFITKRGLIEVSFSYSESCKNVYFSKTILLDEKVTNIRVLKSILK